MSKLIKLNANDHSGISDHGIAHVNLQILNAEYNPKIMNVNHMSRLSYLNADDISGINNSGIACINLQTLIADYNPKITNVNQWKTLELSQN